MNDENLRTARAGLTQVIEPADSLGVYAVRAWGPTRLVEIVQGSTPSQQDWIAMTALDPGNGEFTEQLRRHIAAAIERWRRRSSYLDPKRALEHIRRLGGQFITPEDDVWPAALADLDETEPLGLWTLGPATIPSLDTMISLVGSREATPYGNSVTRMLVNAARRLGLTVLSGGAYGIDAQAHRAALETSEPGLPTVAVLAGGLDRFYPAGNVDLLHYIARDGLLITEMPPGMRPNRYRFLNRNRIIAALSSATIVIEARYRSGALNTAHHAHDIGRNVGAVPGPINTPSSAGCHRLIKETPTLLVDDPTDIEMMYGRERVPEQHDKGSDQRAHDNLTVEELLIFDALPVRGTANIGNLSGITGLAVPQITSVLAKFERQRLAVKHAAGWQKSKDSWL